MTTPSVVFLLCAQEEGGRDFGKLLAVSVIPRQKPIDRINIFDIWIK